MFSPIICHFDGEHRFLSNFYPGVVKLDGIEYPTVEHAYQAAKTDDRFVRARINELQYPGAAKKFGRTIRLRHDWDTVKIDIMTDLVSQKFSVEPLRSMLLATGDALLIEGNKWGDVFWGVCNGEGENHLGRIIMQVRTAIA